MNVSTAQPPELPQSKREAALRTNEPAPTIPIASIPFTEIFGSSSNESINSQPSSQDEIHTIFLNRVVADLSQQAPADSPQAPPETIAESPAAEVIIAEVTDDAPQAIVNPLPLDVPTAEPIPAKSITATSVAPEQLPSLQHLDLQWWAPQVWQPVLQTNAFLTFDAASIMVDGLTHSPRIRAVAAKPLVARADIVDAQAQFDPELLIENLAGRTSDPVGNSLVTGGAPRLREATLTYRMGLQDRNRHGGQLNVVQEVGLLDNNSSFLLPRNQGNSRLSLSLTQPILAGAGRVYNERLIVQAQIDHGIAWQQSLDVVQTRLADIYAAYWQLYELRAAAIQQHDLVSRGLWVQRRIEQRQKLDVGRSQMVRVNAAIARRQTQMIRSLASIGDQQSRLIALVGSPELSSNRGSELIPMDAPNFVPISGTREEAIFMGLQHHPRIQIASEQIQSAALALNVTRNQLLPVLNGVLETYVAGLNGRSNFLRSVGDQFAEGEPGFSAGLEYRFPIGNRAAQARHRRQRYVLQQQSNELREVLLEVTAEIEIAHRAVDVAKAEIEARLKTLEAARNEEAYFARRWELVPSEDGSASFLLEDLLDSQQRRTEAESQWVAANVKYLVSIARLQQAMGTLLMSENISPVETCTGDGTRIIYQKQTTEGADHE